ncbi:TonB-dependent receptor [Pedobacter sp. P351]|uniref:TonB-dependent receptor n=1 Tax=Pedobacter superstes TaxID=3133441 RepID=UPI0030AA07AD
MKHLLWTSCLLCLSSFSLLAQDAYSVRGIVRDTSANADLVNASIGVLNSKDSTLVKFTRAGSDGSFSLTNLKPGKFILLVTYPKYADYVENFTLDSAKKAADFGKINMFLKSKLLADVIIQGKVAAIKIKGDTTEYNAGSFQIQPNSKVEDLLKQLPGIQVDKDGKITAQGETVSKVLVDGEEFFGDDPTLVTKNLRGDMVDKVQLYDKKSDQATFTGIDDGVKTKTINIKLKEDKKQGYFGKVDGGGADGDFYQGQAMFNAFKAKQKIAAYATVANTGKTGLSWEDGNKYGASSVEMTDGGGIMISSGGDDIYYNGQGIPSAETGGAHYDGKWNNDKESINTNYKAGALSIDGVRNNLSQTNLPQRTANGLDTTATFNGNDNQQFSNYTFRQKLDATYELKIDSSSNLKVALDGTLRKNRSNNSNFSENTRENDFRENINQNNSNRITSNDGKNKSLNATIFYNRKLKKKGRTFSISLGQALSQNDDEGFLYSKINYYDDLGTFTRDTVVDQFKTNNSVSSRFNSNITFTEPLSATLSVVLNYGLNLNNSSSDRKSFNKGSLNSYDILDDVFSNNFDYNQTSNQGGAIFNYKKDKTVINFGSKVDRVVLEQIDLNADRNYKRNFINLSPQFSYQYRFTQYKSLRIGYNGNTQQPGINQIQPIRVNTDPLNISLGNPDLKASFRSSINVSYNTFKVLSNQYFYVNGSYSFNVNQIVNSTDTDPETGKSIYQSLNLTDKVSSNYYFRGNFSRKIDALGFNVGFNFSANGNKSFNYINQVLNTLQSDSYSGGLSLYKYVAKKYDFNINMGPSYNTNKSTVQNRVNNNGGGFRSGGSFSIYLPGKLQISSDYEYTLTKKTETFNQDVDYFIWNSSLSKKFLKDESLKLSLSGNDLLNQNIGFRRNAYGNSISQNSYTTIKRYYLVSLLWDFNKMGGGLKAKN